MSYRLLLHALTLLALASQAPGQSFFVDVANGDDTNSGTSWSMAWRTLSHAVSHTPASSVIEIAPGVYDAAHGELFPINFGLKNLRGVEGPRKTIVDGGGQTVFSSGSGWGSASLEGLWIRNGNRGVELEFMAISVEVYPVLHLRDVMITDMGGDAVNGWLWTDWFDCGMTLILERSIIERCGAAMILEVFCDPNHPSVAPMGYGEIHCRDSLIRECGHGMRGFAYSNAIIDPISVVGSTIVDNAGWCITNSPGWGPAGGAHVNSSILWGNGNEIGAPSDVRYSNTELSLHPGSGNLSADPLFLNPGARDFRLRYGSPCVDAGDPALASGLDQWGIPRPVDGDLDTVQRADMGAHELATLAFHGQPRIGTTADLELWGPPAGTSVLCLRRGELDLPIQTVYGEWLLGRPRVIHAVTSTQSGPPALFPFAIPLDPTLVGQVLSFQAISPSSVVSPPLALTNAITFTLLP